MPITSSGITGGGNNLSSAGALINSATSKTTPVDADYVGLMDSAASNVLKKLSWANIKATLKTYFDTLYYGSGANPTFGTITPTVGIVGSSDNSDAVAGSIGEYISSSVTAGNAISLTSTVSINVTSISLTAGDWDVFGTVNFIPGATTSITYTAGGNSQTTNTLGSLGSFFGRTIAAIVPGAIGQVEAIPTNRVRLSATTTIYLVANATFTISTLGAYGFIGARRRR